MAKKMGRAAAARAKKEAKERAAKEAADLANRPKEAPPAHP